MDEIVSRAERIIFRSKMMYLEELAIDKLSMRSGLAYTPLIAASPVTYIVTHDGKHIGRLRRESTSNDCKWWYAIPNSGWCKHLGPFASVEAAAEALQEHIYLFD
ncbi:hypothetical protein B2J88_52305 [Rhodococcus sp. SRB_17]|nr:hypothetical protein [Rhodococcus sp. SRB_17]